MSARYVMTLRRRRLGRELRRLREAAGKTIAKAASGLYISTSKISRIETAHTMPTRRDVSDMLRFYGVRGQERLRLLLLAEAAREEPWWQRFPDLHKLMTYVSFEEEARSIAIYQALLIPGLLQTEEYARGVIGVVVPRVLPALHPDETERHVRVRMARQVLLTGEEPPDVQVLLDEAVLRRRVGDRHVMQRQLRHLTQAAALPNVTLQVLPFAAGAQVGMEGSFTIMQFSDPADPDLVFVEQQSGADRYLDGIDDVKLHRLLFDHLAAAALQPKESSAFIVALETEL